MWIEEKQEAHAATKKETARHLRQQNATEHFKVSERFVILTHAEKREPVATKEFALKQLREIAREYFRAWAHRAIRIHVAPYAFAQALDYRRSWMMTVIAGLNNYAIRHLEEQWSPVILFGEPGLKSAVLISHRIVVSQGSVLTRSPRLMLLHARFLRVAMEERRSAEVALITLFCLINALTAHELR